MENAPLGGSTTCLHFAYYTQVVRSSTQTCQILKIKWLQYKTVLLCRLHKYKNVIHVIIDSHCVYQNYPTYLLAHEQIRLLSRDAFSLCAFKFWRVNNGYALHARNSLLKGMGDETLIGLLHVTPKKHPLLIKRTGITRLDHALGAPAVFPSLN